MKGGQMEKKQATTTELVPANVRTSVHLDCTEADTMAATTLGIALSGTVEERIGRAVYAFNNATRYAVEAGYLLLSVKSDVEHGQFESGIEGLGLNRHRASELMRMAKFATALPEERRAEMMQLPKSKVLALAAADPEVIADLLENPGDVDALGELSVRELRQRIRDAEAAKADMAVERDTAVAEREGLAKQLRKRERDAEEHEGMPVVIADMRAEGAALVKKAELALSGLYPLGIEMFNLRGSEGLEGYVTPSLRLVMSGIVALRIQADGLIEQFAKALGNEVRDLPNAPQGLEFLEPDEIQAVAENWARLVALDKHEAALRAHEREQAKPKGKGRPKNAPQALDA